MMPVRNMIPGWNSNPIEVTLHVQNAGLSISSIHHCHHSKQINASGDMIFSHKAGERICLVKYGVADQDDGADFFLDVSRIATSLDNPAE